MISSSTPSSLVDEIARRRFEAAWRSGEPSPPIENFLPGYEDTRYLATLEERVLIELELSSKSYRRPSGTDLKSVLPAPPRRIEDYLAQFPRLNRPEILRRLVEEEYEVRRRYGDEPSFEEY